MELRQIRHFLAVAEELNFTRASQRIGISQPPLSQSIRSLEHEIGAPLFDRTRRKVELTEAGRSFLIYARRLVNATAQARDAVQAVCGGRRGVISVGCIYSSLYTTIPRALRILEQTHPEAEVRVQEMPIAQQIGALHEWRIDCGILRPPVADREIVTETLMLEPFVAAIPTDHALAARDELSLEDLLSEPFIGIDSAFNRSYSAVVASAFASVQGSIGVVCEAFDMHSLLALVGAGKGVALVPASMRVIRVDCVAYKPISANAPKIALCAAWHREADSPLLPHFVAAARKASRGA